ARRCVRGSQCDARAGKNAGEGAAAAEFALYVQMRVVSQQYVLDDRQSEAGATRGTRAGSIDAVEALGEMWNVFGCDAIAGVGDGKLCAVVVGEPAQADQAG